MLGQDSKEQLNRSIRNLLVAADQVCPIIIGKAHVLFTLADNQRELIAEKIVAEIKKEAQELLNVVLEVEGASKATSPDNSVSTR